MDDCFNLNEYSLLRIGDQAPAFRSVTMQGTIYFPADYFGKWTLLFSFPSGTDSGSSSEIRTAACVYAEFKALNCELVGISVKGLITTKIQTQSIDGIIEDKWNKNTKLKFPLIEDNTLEVARKYGIIQPDNYNRFGFRSVFIIDPECMIRSIIHYPITIEFNFNELKRVLVALQTEDETVLSEDNIAITLPENQNARHKSDEFSFLTRELSKAKVEHIN